MSEENFYNKTYIILKDTDKQQITLCPASKEEIENLEQDIVPEDAHTIIGYGRSDEVTEGKIHKFIEKIPISEEAVQKRYDFCNSTQHNKQTIDQIRDKYICYQKCLDYHDSGLSAYKCALELLGNPEFIIIQLINKEDETNSSNTEISTTSSTESESTKEIL